MSDNKIEPCPYKSLPDYAFWRRSVSNEPRSQLDPIISTKFQITKTDRIATAGSCFAQHIARFLAQSGYNYFMTEPPHPLMSQELRQQFNYGTFTARFANIYTTRQLLQMFKRAYGLFKPKDNVWREKNRFIDPFRPFIQPRGFSSKQEFQEDRERHFAAIREMVEQLDVFVFTLGLTEAWQSREDGAVYPISPGCGAGEHDSSRHEFVNFGVDEVLADLREAVEFISERNPSARFLLTVSPVPLIATYEKQHVLVSTTYSKSVLRVVAEMLKNEREDVDYFPSYELITGNFSGGRYYEDDLREVRAEGVRHAMMCFFRHYLGEEIGPPAEAPAKPAGADAKAPEKAEPSRNERIGEIICDEERLEAEL